MDKQVNEFYERLWPGSANGMRCVTTLTSSTGKAGKPSTIPRNFFFAANAEAVAKGAELDQPGVNVYHGCSLYSSAANRTAANTCGAYAIWVDVDFKDFPAPEIAMAELKRFLSSLTGIVPTSVDSGGGRHCYWFTTDAISAAETKAYGGKINAIAEAVGFNIDTTCTADPARILRQPGTRNHKYDPPRLVSIKRLGDPVPKAQLFADIDTAYTKYCGNEVGLPAGVPARAGAALNSDLSAGLESHKRITTPAALAELLPFIKPEPGEDDISHKDWLAVVFGAIEDVGPDAVPVLREHFEKGAAYNAKNFNDTVKIALGKRGDAGNKGLGRAIDLARAGGWKPANGESAKTANPRKFPKSDADMSDRLADGYCGRLAYIEGVGWAAYDETAGVWKIDADGAGAKRAAIENARDMERAGVQLDDLEKRKTVMMRSLGYQSAKGVNAVLTLAQAHTKLRRQVSEFDAAPWLLGLKNGVLDLKRGVLLPHSPDFCITVAAPVVFDATGTCPLWVAHIEMILPDPEVRRTLQQWFGLCLTGDISPQCFLYAFGWGKNGKSITFEILRALLGPLSGWLSLKALMARAEDDKATGELMRMRPFRAGIANEVEEGQMINESALKNIGGDEVIRARGNHKDPIEYRNQTKLTIVGNHLPVVRGADDGFWRRLVLMPFEVQIPEEQRDLNVREKLTAELPGILNWALAGLADYLEHGRLYIAPRIKRAVAEFRGESDVLGQWVDERLEPAPGEFLANPSLYDDARNWFAANGFGVPSSGKLGRRLKEKGFAQGRGTRGERGWANVRLRLRRGN